MTIPENTIYIGGYADPVPNLHVDLMLNNTSDIEREDLRPVDPYDELQMRKLGLRAFLRPGEPARDLADIIIMQRDYEAQFKLRQEAGREDEK
jgi:hypothetical protein